MKPDISVVIPNRDGGATIEGCLERVLASDCGSFEVVVVDDCSQDDSVEKIRSFPCRLVKLDAHAGAAAARNIGARHSRGGVLFFTDADCLFEKDTLSTAYASLSEAGPGTVVGGTYTRESPDKTFFGTFQSVFINYFETKNHDRPDYVATHAMAIHAETFAAQGGFPEHFLPILEDVEFSHRLRRSGCRLMINPAVEVGHVFNFSLAGSLRNAWRKSRFWTMYSVHNRDLLSDSGTASHELKLNVSLCFLCLAGLFLQGILRSPFVTLAIVLTLAVNILFNRRLLKAFFSTGGLFFGLAASAYYLSLYPLAVGAGALSGLTDRSRAWIPSEQGR